MFRIPRSSKPSAKSVFSFEEQLKFTLRDKLLGDKTVADEIRQLAAERGSPVNKKGHPMQKVSSCMRVIETAIKKKKQPILDVLTKYGIDSARSWDDQDFDQIKSLIK